MQRASDPWPNLQKVDSLYVRKSCQADDVHRGPFSGGRYKADVRDHADADTRLCLAKGTIAGVKGADIRDLLVIGKDFTCDFDPQGQFTVKHSYNSFQREASQALANDVKKQLDDAKLPDIIKNLRDLSVLGMPADSFAYFPRKGYPESNCAVQGPALMAKRASG